MALIKQRKLTVLDTCFLLSDGNLDPPAHWLNEEGGCLRCKVVTAKEARPETSENNFLEEEKPKSSKKASSQRSKSNKKDKRELEEEKTMR